MRRLGCYRPERENVKTQQGWNSFSRKVFEIMFARLSLPLIFSIILLLFFFRLMWCVYLLVYELKVKEHTLHKHRHTQPQNLCSYEPDALMGQGESKVKPSPPAVNRSANYKPVVSGMQTGDNPTKKTSSVFDFKGRRTLEIGTCRLP